MCSTESYRPANELERIKITPEMIEAGKVAFYSVLDMPPFSDATVTDLVAAIASGLIAALPNDR